MQEESEKHGSLELISLEWGHRHRSRCLECDRRTPPGAVRPATRAVRQHFGVGGAHCLVFASARGERSLWLDWLCHPILWHDPGDWFPVYTSVRSQRLRRVAKSRAARRTDRYCHRDWPCDHDRGGDRIWHHFSAGGCLSEVGCLPFDAWLRDRACWCGPVPPAQGGRRGDLERWFARSELRTLLWSKGSQLSNF